MPRYYCDYCDTYLTHDSPSVRKQHNAGYKHKANVREYYQQFEQEQTQSLIDQRVKEHLGNSAAYGGQPYGQIGAAYNQHLMSQPRLPGMPQMLPGIRPPVLPRPPILNAPGYSSAPHMIPMMAPPGAPGMPGQLSAPMRPPPALNPPPAVPGSTAPNASNGPPLWLHLRCINPIQQHQQVEAMKVSIRILSLLILVSNVVKSAVNSNPENDSCCSTFIGEVFCHNLVRWGFHHVMQTRSLSFVMKRLCNLTFL